VLGAIAFGRAAFAAAHGLCGIFFNMTGAAVSHAVCGDSVGHLIAPIIIAVLAVASLGASIAKPYP
jgi:hypothetical protein